MIEQGGAIVNNASVLGLVGLAGGAAYVASKHGVVGLTKSAALEFAPKNIRVNAVCPGYVLTDMTRSTLTDPTQLEKAMEKEPLGRFAEPEEIAALVLESSVVRYGSGDRSGWRVDGAIAGTSDR